MGRPEEEQLLSCLIAFKGLDVTRNVAEHYRKNPEVLTSAVQDALPAIRRVLSFFKRHAEIPHLRLLPRSIPLVVLTRFFALYPEPSARTLTLLTRWAWRALLSANFYDERTLLRHGVAAIQDGDEEQNAQKLLGLVPRERRAEYVLPQRFDARAADSRLALLGMSSLGPISLLDETPIDIAELIERDGVGAFRRILPSEDILGQSPANRILLPGSGAARKELVGHATRGISEVVLRSHALSAYAMESLLKREIEPFLMERKSRIEEAVNLLGERMAAWSRTDRPSISYLLEQADAEPDGFSEKGDEESPHSSSEEEAETGALRCSLAGVQLKFSVIREGQN